MASVPFDQLDGFIWMNGEFVKWADAKIHVLTHGLHYASAVFEGERAYGGEIFKLTEHTERLHESGAHPRLQDPLFASPRSTTPAATLLKKQGFADAYVRPIAWRGSEKMGVSAQNNRINCAIAIWQWPSYFDPAQKLKGIRLDMAEYRRPDPRTAPSHAKAAGLYMICTLSKHAAEAKGYADAMMLDWRGQVAEATGANIFFVKDGKIHTPDPDCFLDGITRRTVIDLAAPARHRGHRAGDHAGRAGRLRAVLPHRHGRRGDAGRRDRAVPLRGRRDRQDADERLFGRSAAEARDRRRVSSSCLSVMRAVLAVRHIVVPRS